MLIIDQTMTILAIKDVDGDVILIVNKVRSIDHPVNRQLETSEYGYRVGALVKVGKARKVLVQCTASHCWPTQILGPCVHIHIIIVKMNIVHTELASGTNRALVLDWSCSFRHEQQWLVVHVQHVDRLHNML